MHHGHVFRIELREVVGVRERHDVERIGKAAHEILLARGLLGRVVQPGVNDKVLGLLVGSQCRGIFGPEFGVLFPRLVYLILHGLHLRPVAACREGCGRNAQQQETYRQFRFHVHDNYLLYGLQSHHTRVPMTSPVRSPFCCSASSVWIAVWRLVLFCWYSSTG